MDFASLREKIVEERDLVLFDEAVSCLKGGAWRAAYITTWLSIAESLKFKFYDMSTKDHEIKKKVIRKIEENEERGRPTDSLLITFAEEFGLITKEQKLKLEHIKTMRGIYAHPLNKAPSPSEVELAIELAVEIVLSQPALLKHAFVKDLVVSIFENHHYLDDNPEKIEKYAESTLNHINPVVFPYFFKLLIQNLDRISNDITKELFKRRGTIFLKTLLRKAKDVFSTDSWEVIELLHKYYSVVSNIFAHEEFWPLLNEYAQDAIVGYLLEPVQNGKIVNPSVENISKILDLYNLGKLTERHIERFMRVLEKCSIKTKMLAGIPIDWYIEQLITDLKSYNWYVQNSVIEVIETLGPEQINLLNNEILIELGRNVLQSADGGARKAEEFVMSLCKTRLNWSSFFIEGIFLETFINHNGKLRFKKYFRYAVAALLVTEKQDRERIINKAIELLKHASPKGWLTEKSFQNYLTFLQEGIEKTNGSRKVHLERFKSALEETKDRILKELDEEEGF